MNVHAAKAHRSHRGAVRPRRVAQAPNQDNASMSTPMPTITRKAKNTGATGGRSGSKASSPFTSARFSWRRMRLAPYGSSIA